MALIVALVQAMVLVTACRQPIPAEFTNTAMITVFETDRLVLNEHAPISSFYVSKLSTDAHSPQSSKISGDVYYFVGRDGTYVIRDGEKNRIDTTGSHFTRFSQIPASDLRGTWVTLGDTMGHLWRIRHDHRLEEIGDRYGLAEQHIVSVQAMGGPYVALQLTSEIAIANGTHVTRFPLDFRTLHSTSQKLVGIAKQTGKVRVLTVDGKSMEFDIPNSKDAAFLSDGSLAVLSSNALYVKNLGGSMSLRYLSTDRPLTNLRISGDNIWFQKEEDLLFYRNQSLSYVPNVQITQTMRTWPDRNGDLWTEKEGTLTRWSPSDREEHLPIWRSVIAPIFRNACRQCHHEKALIPLHNRESWKNKEVAIRKRVVMERTMPPQLEMLTELDRQQIKDWLDSRQE